MTTSRYIFIFIGIIALSCNGKKAALQEVSDEPPYPEAANVELVSMVPESVKLYCYPCHNPSAPSHDAIIAPPLAAVKMRYNMTYSSKDEFINNMMTFLQEPKKESAIMYGAVKRFGLMARTGADEKTLREIVEYIYSNKVEQPAWFNPGMMQDDQK